ncbi:hypothetical protein HCH_02112 [Hahella chejuensis KCTC 2396]|uniref:Uncharacterized protein n=1 Tax=Hahella chejuensis (strain KCTC 2396) TaxID=349521 RepID=Q2SK83_HAHCH|nr:hypothetical protein HCH_02112 [Hahella chejuensis KCTC 2396]
MCSTLVGKLNRRGLDLHEASAQQTAVTNRLSAAVKKTSTSKA